MNTNDEYIHLPDVYLKLDTLKNHLKKIYKINITNMANESKHSGYNDEKMAMINCDIIHEYAIKLDNMIDEDTRLEEWVKMKLSKVELMVASVKHALVGIETYDDGGEIAKKQLLHIGKYAEKLIEMLKGGSELMSWMESNLSICADYMDSIYHHLDYKLLGNRASDLGGMSRRKQDIPGFEGTLSGLGELSIRKNGGGVGDGDAMTHEEFVSFVKSKVNKVAHGYSYKGKKYTNITDLGKDLGYRFNGDKWIKLKFAIGGGVGELEIGNEIEIELNNGKIVKGKVEKLSPLKIRTEDTSTQIIPNPLIKNIKKYANGGGVMKTQREIISEIKNEYGERKIGDIYEEGTDIIVLTDNYSAAISISNDYYGDFDSEEDNDDWEYDYAFKVTISKQFNNGGGVELEDEEAEWYDKQTLKYKNQTEQDRKATHRHYYNMYNDEFTKWWYSGGMEESMKKYAKKLRNEDDFNTAWSLAFEDFIVRKEGGGIEGETYICEKEGRIEIYSGTDARSAEVKFGDTFVVTEEMSNGIYYLGKLKTKGSFKLNAGLSGKDVSKSYYGNQNEILYLLRKQNIGGDSDFFAQFKKIHANGGGVGSFPFIKFEDAQEAIKKVNKGELPKYFSYVEKEKNLYYLPNITGDWVKLESFETKQEAVNWIKNNLKSEGFANGGGVAERINEKDFEEGKSFILGNTKIILSKKQNPKYFTAEYIDTTDNEVIGVYGSPNFEDVRYDILTQKFANGGGVEKMERGSRLNTNWVGRKEKEMWGQYDLSEMYNNNLDLIADVHDYFEKLKMDISEGYSNDIKKHLIEVLKTGNLKGQSLQENIKF